MVNAPADQGTGRRFERIKDVIFKNMTTQDIYKLAVELGSKADLRGLARVKKHLERTKEKYDKLGKDRKAEFDLEKLTNPYSDTRVLVDNKKKQIKKVLVGIDIDGAELLLADKLGDIDLVISHHPDGAVQRPAHASAGCRHDAVRRRAGRPA